MSTSDGKRGPLVGIRVLELGSLLAGPFCGQLMSDLGAEVIKVEPPGQGDVMRIMGRARIEGRGLWWPHIARGKKCITLDLRVPEGQQLARELIRRCDVVVENFRPGTLERWNLSYDELSADHPGLILTRVTGYGQTGPYRDRAGFGGVGEAMGGLRYVTGFPDRPPPRVGISIGDMLAGIFGLVGTLAALHERSRSGRGQVVDVAIYEAVAAMMESTLADYSAAGVTRERTGGTLPGFAPSNAYLTKDGNWYVLGANAKNPFRRLCEVMGRPELADDPRYATDAARAERMEELDELVGEWVATKTSDELTEILSAAGVPGGPTFDAAMALADPHYRTRGMLHEVEDDTLGRFVMPGVVPKLSRTPGSIPWIGPGLGEHDDEVFGELLRIAPERRRELAEARVTGAAGPQASGPPALTRREEEARP
jgi:crotonobetainyl-CoA:carnitine CoA-transferase CaiB-like acyl-CoA transferase